MTKAQARKLANYINGKNHLSDLYKNYSRAKEVAAIYCEDLMKKYNGYGLRFCTANTFMFTAGFQFRRGDDTYLMYITPTKDEYFKIN